MYIIGITGPTGAGKTSALQALKTLGALTLDCDEIYHQMLISNTEMTADIEARFKDALTDGKVDRYKLGNLVWDDPTALHDLNVITHGYISNEVDRQIAVFKAQGGLVTAIDAIALVESGQSERCNTIVGITAPLKDRVFRIMKRDGLTGEHALIRVHAQPPDSYYREHCDHILENTFDTQAEFIKECTEFFKKLLNTQADTQENTPKI